MLATKIQNKVSAALKSIKIDWKDAAFSYHQFEKLMQTMNYYRDGCQILLRQAWEIISEDSVASQQNLTNFLTAIENIPCHAVIKALP